jgi:DNA-binding beta-propeller fold protein YncE
MRYLTNSTTGRNGTVIAGGNGGGSANNQLNYPWGIDYLPLVSNYLYITNIYGHTVMQWAPGASSGTVIAGTSNRAGSSATLLNTPMGIKIDAYLNTYVVDNANHRVQMFCRNSRIGITIAGTGTSGSSAIQLNAPRAIAFDSSMNMYITDYDNLRIQKFIKL